MEKTFYVCVHQETGGHFIDIYTEHGMKDVCKEYGADLNELPTSWEHLKAHTLQGNDCFIYIQYHNVRKKKDLKQLLVQTMQNVEINRIKEHLTTLRPFAQVQVSIETRAIDVLHTTKEDGVVEQIVDIMEASGDVYSEWYNTDSGGCIIMGEGEGETHLLADFASGSIGEQTGEFPAYFLFEGHIYSLRRDRSIQYEKPLPYTYEDMVASRFTWPDIESAEKAYDGIIDSIEEDLELYQYAITYFDSGWHVLKRTDGQYEVTYDRSTIVGTLEECELSFWNNYLKDEAIRPKPILA